MDQTPQFAPTPAPVMPAKSGKIKSIIWSLVAIVVVLGGYAAYAKYASMWPFKSTIDTSDWKTYTNTKYGISFQYPKNLSVRESMPEISGELLYVLVETAQRATFAVTILPYDKNLENNPAVNPCIFEGCVSAQEVVAVGKESKTAYTTNTPPVWECYGIGLWCSESRFNVVADNKIYSFDISGTIENGQIPDMAKQILSTFKLDMLTTWKTYTNAQYGFEVQYPAEYKINIAPIGDAATTIAISEFTISDLQDIQLYQRNFQPAIVITIINPERFAYPEELNRKTIAEKYISLFLDYTNHSGTAYSVDGTPGELRTYHIVSLGPGEDFLLFTHNGLIYQINAPDQVFLQHVKTILSTFKFIK